MRQREIIWLTFWVTMTLWYGQGCQNVNTNNQTWQGQTLQGIDPETDYHFFEGQPSVSSLDRSDWQPTEISLSRDDLETRPTFWRSYVWARPHRVRASGGYPTTDSALELSTGLMSTRGQYLEMAVDPFVQLGQILYAPIRLLRGERPRQINRGPWQDYQLEPVAVPARLTGR